MRTSHFHCDDTSSNLVRVTRFVGVMVNITDCRSVAMGSIPVRTACVSGGAMVSISEFDSEDIGSNPVLIAIMLALAYR